MLTKKHNTVAKGEYLGKFIPFTFLFFLLAISIWLLTPELKGYAIFIIICMFLCFAFISSKLIVEGKETDDILLPIYLYMLAMFLTVFFLVATLGGIFHSAFASLLTISQISNIFTFKASSVNKKENIRHGAVFVYIFTCFMFDPEIIGIPYENLILESLTDDGAKDIIKSVGFQQVTLIMFVICIGNAIWSFPHFRKHRIAFHNWIQMILRPIK